MQAHPTADFIVLSDHGFTTFSRAVNVNTWLFSQGLLTLKAPDQIDWQSTKTYAMGLNALYVTDPALIDPLSERLLAFRDPANGKQVVQAVYRTHPTLENAHFAPDLIVGYSPGYRASWETGLGQIPRTIIDDNTEAWIADHCIDPAAVLGVLFTSFPLRAPVPGLADVTALLLQIY